MEPNYMFGKFKRILTLGLIIIVCLGLFAACDSADLKEYKQTKIKELQDYADIVEQEKDCTIDGLQAVTQALDNAKKEISAARSKEAVDEAVNVAKEKIAKAVYGAENSEKQEEAKIQLMSGAEEYTVGNGTAEEPYVIGTRGQLIHFSNQINSGENLTSHFELGADIDLEGMEWLPIGIINIYKGNFVGVFDGKGYEVSNYRIHGRYRNSLAENLGLFGCNSGTVKNLGVLDFDINVTWRYQFGFSLSVCAGGLVGSNYGNVENCYAIGNISLDYDGGAKITAPTSIIAGGLVGSNDKDSKIKNCYTSVDINVRYENENCPAEVAGIAVDYHQESEAENCLVTGNVRVFNNGFEEFVKEFVFGLPLTNSYCYEGISIFHGQSDWSFCCSAEDLNNSEFYTDTLGWSTEYWDLDNIEFVDGKYTDGKHPKLKKSQLK